MASNYPNISHVKHSQDWSTENGYNNIDPASQQSYPYRVRSSGIRSGLTAVLRQIDVDLDYICKGPVTGFRVALHAPDELPQMSKNFFRVPLNQDISVTVKPNVVRTADALRSYTPKQ